MLHFVSGTEYYISKTVGLPYNAIVDMDTDELDRHIERKIGKKLKPCMTGQNIYLMKNRLISMDDIERKLAEIIKQV